MAEELQSLIEKINRDGVEKATAEAAKIVSAAKEQAAAIVKAANEEAAKSAAAAEAEAKASAEALAPGSKCFVPSVCFRPTSWAAVPAKKDRCSGQED